MSDFLDIAFMEVGSNFLKATMPVTDKTKQPIGLLHGGASAVLAETIGSVASVCVIDIKTKSIVGLELNCNHIRSAKEGLVTATCSPFHIGKTTHVWNIEIHDEQQKLVCISRLTVMILDKK
jgi:1,4-dihydroxy-2-naphthoyl-CoA hydrolase